jgi:glycine/serine hydroxymethyltransferase
LGIIDGEGRDVALPFLGSGITLFDLLTGPKRGKRMSDWCDDLRQRLNGLSRKVNSLTPEKLAASDAFVSAFAQATIAALKTLQKEKLEALRNAVLNVAVGTTLAEDLQTLFINLIDSFTPQHLLALDYLERRNQALLGKLSAQEDLIDQAVTDLNSRGMIKDTRPYAARDRDAEMPLINCQWDISAMGKQFLAFIKLPD